MTKKNWLNANDSEIKNLKLKLKNKDAEIDNALKEAKKYSEEKKKLEKEEAIFNKKIEDLGQEIVKIDAEINYVKADYLDLEGTTALPRPSGASTDSARVIYNRFVNDYNLKKKIKDWVAVLEKDKKFATNTLTIKLNNQDLLTTFDEADTIIGFVAYQLGKIEKTDFRDKAKKYFGNTNGDTLADEFDALKDEQFDFVYDEASGNNGDDRVFYMFGSESSDIKSTDANGNVSYTAKPTPTPPFPMKRFFDFTQKIGPSHDLNFIKSLNDSATIKNFNIRIMPCGRKYTEDEIKMAGLEPFKEIYFPETDITKALGKRVSGLVESFALLNEAYSNTDNKVKSILWMDTVDAAGAAVINGSVFIPPNFATEGNPYEKLIYELAGGNATTTASDFKRYRYERNRVDGEGTEFVYCISDINDMISERKNREITLGSKKELKKNEISEQIKLLGEHQKKVQDEEDKAEVEIGKIRALMEAAAAEKKTELLKTNFLDANLDWNSPVNILKAAAAKQALLDIKYLKNDSDANGSLENDLQKIWNAIEEGKNKATDPWNAVIKQEFESKGSDLTSRIAKVKEESKAGGIGLAIFRDAYAQLGDQTVVDAINAELAKDKTPSQTKLTKEDLNTVLGITDATDDMVTKWESLSGDWGKNKDNIKGVVNPHISDATKKGKLVEHLKKLPDTDGIDKTSDDTILSSFFKKEPKFIIETIVAHELEDTTHKASIIKEMKKEKSTDGKQQLDRSIYFTGDEPSEEGIKKYAYEKKLGQNHTMKAIATDEPTKDDQKNESWFKFGDGNWRPYVTYIGGVVVLIGVGMAIFWNNISDWWNGPAEEEGKSQTENDEKDEENE